MKHQQRKDARRGIANPANDESQSSIKTLQSVKMAEDFDQDLMFKMQKVQKPEMSLGSLLINNSVNISS